MGHEWWRLFFCACVKSFHWPFLGAAVSVASCCEWRPTCATHRMEAEKPRRRDAGSSTALGRRKHTGLLRGEQVTDIATLLRLPRRGWGREAGRLRATFRVAEML